MEHLPAQPGLCMFLLASVSWVQECGTSGVAVGAVGGWQRPRALTFPCLNLSSSEQGPACSQHCPIPPVSQGWISCRLQFHTGSGSMLLPVPIPWTSTPSIGGRSTDVGAVPVHALACGEVSPPSQHWEYLVLHLMNCGNVFCSSCCNQKVPVPSQQLFEPSR
ncbi:hypothetical protein EK904_007418, partial [Melospiza melodia maxima]